MSQASEPAGDAAASPDPAEPSEGPRPPQRMTLAARRLDEPPGELVYVNPALQKAGWTPPGQPRAPREAAAETDAGTRPALSGAFERAGEAADAIREHLGREVRARVAVILGSGLGAFAEALEDARFVPYESIPGFLRSTVKGHKGRLAHGKVGEHEVLVMQGRYHFYEGHSLEQVTFPVRVLGRLGVKRLIVTNAAGGIGPHLEAGSLMLITDHLNLLGKSPLEGPNDERFGPRFPDMTECYPKALRSLVRSVAPPGTPLEEGVYAALFGPAYETPAEVRMLRTLGADAVGMSTVPEVTVARHMGIPCVGISGIANSAAGLTEGHVLTHQEVVDTMAKVADHFVALLCAAVPALAGAAG